jgi:protein involved in polysaccharide export with SLBB domain
VADRILLRVEGEQQLSDTFTVVPGPALVLPVIGTVPLAEVRRADIEPYLKRELARFLKDPVVHVRVLLRLAVLGEVGRPGFYAVPADAALADALMAAGGPTRDSKLADLRVEREASPLWSNDSLQRAMAQGMTVDQLGLRSGDRIIVPRRRDSEAILRVLGILVTIPAAIYGVTKLVN